MNHTLAIKDLGDLLTAAQLSVNYFRKNGVLESNLHLDATLKFVKVAQHASKYSEEGATIEALTYMSKIMPIPKEYKQATGATLLTPESMALIMIGE